MKIRDLSRGFKMPKQSRHSGGQLMDSLLIHTARTEAEVSHAGTRWTGTRWTGTRWTGTRWTGTRWTGTRWTGTRWTGTRWT